MNELKPADNGVRRFRPGPLLLLCAVGLLALGVGLFKVIRAKQQTPKPVAEKNLIEEIKEEPVAPSIHPLEGKRQIFLADGCDFRYQELTFARNLSEQHGQPLAVVRANDSCLWDFQPVEGKEDWYHIVCADPNYPEAVGKELTYTRLVDDGVPRDDTSPYLTLRSDDPCEWEVRKMPYEDQYELYCRSGNEPFLDQSLGWTEEQEDLTQEEVTATLGRNGNPSWFILAEGQKPKTPRRVSHLIIQPRTETELLGKAREHFDEEGVEIFRVKLETREDEFLRTGKSINYSKLVRGIRDADPVVEHEDFPPIISLNPTKLEEITKTGLFPMVIPLKVALHTHEIRKLTLENTEFWTNGWDEVENFQSYLDESDMSDGRIYQTENFTYIFVAWED